MDRFFLSDFSFNLEYIIAGGPSIRRFQLHDSVIKAVSPIEGSAVSPLHLLLCQEGICLLLICLPVIAAHVPIRRFFGAEDNYEDAGERRRHPRIYRTAHTICLRPLFPYGYAPLHGNPLTSLHLVSFHRLELIKPFLSEPNWRLRGA